VRYHGQDKICVDARTGNTGDIRRQAQPWPWASVKITVQGGLRTYHTLLSSWDSKDSMGK
jgi:hypothetical protein